MKNILLLTTGGTIACVETKDGLVPGLTGEWLIEKIPQIKTQCTITIKPILNIDSSNMYSEDWVIIANAIYEGLKKFDGIVVTHGTDTMAYTTSIISYMLKNVDKPVVFTGSQVPINKEGSDGITNLLQGFQVALSELNKICLVFNGKIILGTRAFKIHSLDEDAFVSCNDSYLGRIKNGKVILEESYDSVKETTKIYSKICDKVFLLKLIPGIRPEIIDFIVNQGYKGVVVEAFGLGGIPSEYTNLLAKFKEITSKYRIPVIVVSQCVYDGANLNVYQVGVEAEKCGLISGRDMSTEAAVTKLMWALGQTEKYEDIEKIMNTNLCGEISKSN
ncbi:asparaginase [Clostridium butyricum]|uniref:asparaginase n=1 Tax=Clostridium butyricum TaxID=1492 RepID=UPI003D3394CB